MTTEEYMRDALLRIRDVCRDNPGPATKFIDGIAKRASERGVDAKSQDDK